MRLNTAKPVKWIFVILLLFIATNCSAPVKVAERPGFCQVMKAQILCLDSLGSSGIDGYEKLDSVNQYIRNLIEQYRNEIATISDTSFENVAIVAAADKKLSLVSWDTRTGGTMPVLAAMAVFCTPRGKVHTVFLKDSLPGEQEMSMIAYQHLYTIHSSRGVLYVALGYGRGSTILPWQQLKVFAIKEEQLIYPAVFPGGVSTCFVELDRTHLKTEELPEIKVERNGQLILLPETIEHGGFTGSFKKLVFKDSAYYAAY
ncbi:hypothetical protein HNQ91_001735 [Filimonas zeae]|uniref:Uncharacterized protein n=1 Tax=Filimonas zeae TaxID=1737353 RepID=A0A917MVP8_9BACT|nr:hypothetical protein [Filimonas zeae]MDR6338684.1 hypothetical protein [Filimonas zeae]GGH67068.1 hypothetical protein GCM10011379_21930 [Filimonas zeae]